MTSYSSYLFRACYTSTMDTNEPGLFSLTVNGVLQPQSSYLLRAAGFNPTNSSPSCPALSSLFYQWKLNSPGTIFGTNVVQLTFTNSSGVNLSDTMTVIVEPPPQPLVSDLSSNHQLISWTSVPNINYQVGLTYQVFATTNLNMPFQLIGTSVPSQGSTTSFYDTNAATQKFYEVEASQ